MRFRLLARKNIGFGLIAALSACSSGSSDSESPVVVQVSDDSITDPGTDPTTDATSGSTADPANDSLLLDPVPETSVADSASPPTVAGGETGALFGRARFITSDCGSLDVSTAVANNSLAAPAQMTVGEPVRGQIVPGSSDNNFHTWRVSLEPGNYHLVADVSVLDEENSLLGLSIDALGATTAEDEGLAAATYFGHDVRLYKYLEIQAARILTLKLDTRYEKIHNYTLGIFLNGTAVPSPTFERCLPINMSSVGTTQSATLDKSFSREDQIWYRIDLGAQEYVLDASAHSVENVLLGHKFLLFEQFEQSESEQVVTTGTEYGNILTTSDTFEPVSAGPAWIRVETAYDSERVVEFTVREP